MIRFLLIEVFFFVHSTKGQWVWIKPQRNAEFATPIGCQIVRFDRGKALIRNDDDEESWIKPEQVKCLIFSVQQNQQQLKLKRKMRETC